MINKVLVANRGEIACRVIRALRKLDIASVAIYSEADIDAPHVADADEAFLLGPAAVAESYLNQDRLLEVIKETGAEAVHPGYGLLSENADFAEACEKAGAVWIGPTPEQMRCFGLKHAAREIAQKSGVPLLAGTELIESVDEALETAQKITYPVMLKSTAGGGGIGMHICHNGKELAETFDAARRLSLTNFGQAGVFLEKYIARARHIEVQIFGDGRGKVVSLGERDCSTQRRNQKVLEESPAPGVSGRQRSDLSVSAVRLGESVSYRSAGTVEYLYDEDSGQFYFLEMNTRLQVEHPVTELCTGVDLVEWMLRLAGGERGFIDGPATVGHAMEARIYAEDPYRDFQPSSGLLTHVEFPEDVRCDTWISTGTEVSAFYDPMLAKLIVHGSDRADALTKLGHALAGTTIAGIETNLEYLCQIVTGDLYQEGRMTTRALDSFEYSPQTISVISGGMQTTVQDFPGRRHYWNVGIPPSGPMDPLSFRLANKIVGNPAEAAGIEITQMGPSLQFNCDCKIAITGAEFPVVLDGGSVVPFRPITVTKGSVLEFGNATGSGSRGYLAVGGGFDVPLYLGSRSTFTLGQFGGHGGRALQAGDVLTVGDMESSGEGAGELSRELRPALTQEWEIGVLYGPHGAPDFFTAEDIETFYGTAWEVHYNSARTGVRLIGPKPKWARADGGEAGLHPSNIHDNAYAIGAIDFTGDMPVILGPDGPSLGGFVCPAVVAEAELWKVGQLKGGDRVRFRNLSTAGARELYRSLEAVLAAPGHSALPCLPREEPVPGGGGIIGQADGVTFRRAGDSYLLVEYGDLVLDLELRFKVHVVYQWLLENKIGAILDVTPGIRSLQLHFDQSQVGFEELIDHVLRAESEFGDLGDIDIPARTVYLPLSWGDPSIQETIDKYTESVNPDAPWCPSNIEFIRRINGLGSIEDVYRTVFEATYLVMGLGDVYLGAPVATPLDPRHRLVTTKYNPARTWTPENVVGIGGAYLCVYGMEGPGGYQLFGRTVQMWNRFRSTVDFEEGKPWLLRFFDHIKFYPVSHEELTRYRRDFLQGRFQLKVEETTFNLVGYRKFLADNDAEISSFRECQQVAFQEERQRWEDAGLNVVSPVEKEEPPPVVLELAEGWATIESPINGSIWRMPVEEGQAVEAGDTVAILQAMKMEMNVRATKSGAVREILCREGDEVKPGTPLLVFEAAKNF